MTLVVVGAGRIGGMVVDLARRQGVEVAVAGRQGPVATTGGRGPVLVCTRNDALADVVARTPGDRRDDLVFVQNGVLAPWLRARGLAGATIGVLYVAVDRPGAPPVPGAPSVFMGPQARAVAALLAAGGVPAREAAHPLDLRREVGTKLAWICVLGVLGEALALPVGQLVVDHAAGITSLCEELAPVLAADPDTAANPDLVPQVLAYSRSVPHYRTAVKEWPWRTGWLLQAAARAGIDLPQHRAWLVRAGHGPQLSAGRAP